jgi:hypothetical protein
MLAMALTLWCTALAAQQAAPAGSATTVPAGWRTYSNPTYRFRVAYPPAYAIAPEKEPLADDVRLRIRFQDAALLTTPFGELEPARLSIEVIAVDVPIALLDWLTSNGRLLQGAVTSRVVLPGAVEGVRVQSPLQFAPNQFYYFRTSRFVYAVTPLGSDSDIMLASFQLF